ncbi:hypothetical protein K435DRAFT_789536 [Dendrothele bispora CBS 962.96]|uniref:Uncharacterized protein n=1 Tax=Dendrothele bispora (strain CBS 962.96) TaxID=1314807 RepID=A0A4S8MT80_DENBC|nr:hypothetical protein K435DRAFT_789536 [Dendrothele bispora CBS 962.96]
MSWLNYIKREGPRDVLDSLNISKATLGCTRVWVEVSKLSNPQVLAPNPQNCTHKSDTSFVKTLGNLHYILQNPPSWTLSLSYIEGSVMGEVLSGPWLSTKHTNWSMHAESRGRRDVNPGHQVGEKKIECEVPIFGQLDHSFGLFQGVVSI